MSVNPSGTRSGYARRSRPWRGLAVGLLLAAPATGCGDDAPPSASSTTVTSATEPSVDGTAAGQTLNILVTNDDGVSGEGLDALVEALTDLPATTVQVVAPATDKSGTGPSTTTGTLTATDTTTLSGHPAKAVAGFPADTIVWAIDQGGVADRPDLVISGINKGQNLGSVIPVSGTVGAARTAATRGLPALAVSQGLAEEPDYPTGVRHALDWVAAHRAALAGRGGEGVGVVFDNMNVPTCPVGQVRGELEVPPATTTGGEVATPDCESTAPAPADDVSAFNAGFATVSALTP